METLTLDCARKILEAIAQRGFGSQRVPIKVNPSAVGCGHEQHWKRANLVGVHGRNFIIRPLNGHKKDESVSEGNVKLWRSKMSPDIATLVRDIEISLMPVPRRNDDALDLAVLGVEQTIIAEIITEPPVERKESVSTSTSSPSDFQAKLEQYHKLREELTLAAQTEGMDKLHALHADRTNALQYVVEVETQIDQTIAELKEFQVHIPEDLKVKHKTVAPPSKPSDTHPRRPRVSVLAGAADRQ